MPNRERRTAGITSARPPHDVKTITAGGAHEIGKSPEAMDRTLTTLPKAAMPLEIRLFGRGGVSAAGVPLKFAKRSTTLAMLALILLQRGQSMSRESLAFTLFPEADEAGALAELRRYLYLANKALPARAGDPWLIVDSETVRWNTEAEAFVDVIAFERLAANAGTQPEALELYGGDLLEEIYDDWVVGERERMRTRYLTIASECLERHRGRREFAPAIACAKRILATDPWREDTLRALLAVRYESGDGAGALAEYEKFAKRLRDELAIAPMPETSAVRQAILRNDALPGSLDLPLRVAERDAPRAISILPFVGRRREFANLHAVWGRAARGAGAFVLVAGEAGIGKTRLIAELARTVLAEGGRVFAGTTSAPEAVPYQAIVEALRSGLPILVARPPVAARRAALARVLPELCDVAAPDIVLPERAPEIETARIYDALAHAVRQLASPRPLLLVLEDVHWAGSATIEALGAVVRSLARAPVLIVASCRDEEAPPDHPLRAFLRSLRPFQNVEELSLERLGQEDVAELVAGVDGLRGRGETLARDLYAHSEGNALFLNEAIIGVLERGETVDDAPPGSIEGVLERRIARLGEDAHTVVQIAAVAGSGCSVALVREVSNVPAAAVARGFDELLDRRIVREAGARANHDYVFTHHLIARAVYEGIEPAFRAQRHLRIARALETEHRVHAATPAREIARHYERAGECAESAQWYLTAARQAAAVHAYGDAVELATRTLEQAASEELRRAALDVRERARGRRGDRAGQGEDIDELERLAGTDPRNVFDVLLRRVRLARTLGESDEEGRFIAELGVVAQSLDEGAGAQALAERATHAGQRSRQSEGLEPARAALEIYERLGDVRGQLECLYLLVELTANVGDLEASRHYLRLMSERAASLDDQVVEGRALAVASTAALLRRDYRESFDLAVRALALHTATSDREGEAWSYGRLAVNAAWLGDFETALRDFDRALETFESIGNKRGLALTHTNRTSLFMRLGLFDDALASIESSNALFDTAHEARTVACNLVNESFVRLQLGDALAAKDLAHRALAAAKEIAFPVFEAAALANLGNAELKLGRPADAIEHMEAGITIRRPLQEPRDFADDLADLTLSYASAGRKREALATAEELCAIGRSSFEGAFWPHYIWWAIAQGLSAGGEVERATQAALRAQDELKAFANAIEDEHARASFMSVAVNARIAAGS
jgi:DNA-binding SARP family transcriptional activator